MAPLVLPHHVNATSVIAILNISNFSLLGCLRTSSNARSQILHRWDSCQRHLMAIFSNAGTLPILPLTSSVSTMIFSPMKSWPTHLRLTLGTWRLKFSLVSALTLSTLNPFCAPDPSFGHSNHLCGNGEHQINFLVIAPATTPAPNS